MAEKAGTRRLPDGYWEGVLRGGRCVTWACGHAHIGQSGHPSAWWPKTAIQCAEAELKNRPRREAADDD